MQLVDQRVVDVEDAGDEEEPRRQERVGEEHQLGACEPRRVEQADPRKHDPDVADDRVGEHSLQVPLQERHRPREHSRRDPEPEEHVAHPVPVPERHREH